MSTVVTRLVLVEECPTDLVAEVGDLVVALTPEAMYELDRRGLPYRPAHELVDEGALVADPDAYLDAQIGWLDLFDDLLWEAAPELQEVVLRPALLYGYHLKAAVDIVRIRSYELRALLDAAPGAEVVHVRRAATDPPADTSLALYEGASVLSKIAPTVCELARRRYVEWIVDAPSPSERLAAVIAESDQLRRDPPLLPRLRGALERLLRRPRPRLTLLLLNGMYDVGDLWREARRNGHRVLVRYDDQIVDVTGARRAVVAALPEGTERWPDVADRLTAPESRMWDWVDDVAGPAAREVLASRLHLFVSDVAPALLQRSQEIARVLAAENVDAVVTATPVDEIDYGAIHAARAASRSRAVIVDHGDSALASQSWDLFYLLPYDDQIVPTAERRAYHLERKGRSSRPTADIHVGSYRWRRFVGLADAGGAAPPRRLPAARPTLVYVPTAIAGDARYLSDTWFPETWYYEVQTAIVRALAADERYEVVVKLFPHREWGMGSLHRYVLDLEAPNLHLSTTPFSHWLPFADRVLFDLPSTAVYETAVAGVPFRIVTAESVPFRPAAAADLAPAVTRFATPADAERVVGQLLREPEWRSPRLAPEGDTILETLVRLSGRNS